MKNKANKLDRWLTRSWAKHTSPDQIRHPMHFRLIKDLIRNIRQRNTDTQFTNSTTVTDPFKVLMTGWKYPSDDRERWFAPPLTKKVNHLNPYKDPATSTRKT